ncbi:arabinosyltransferase domain-containing protein [Blastococcus sp. SYSU D00813]
MSGPPERTVEPVRPPAIDPDVAAPARRRRPGARSVAWVLATLTVLLAVALPLAPVVVDTPEVRWPADGAEPRSITALFMPYRPIDLEVSVPCASARSLGTGDTTEGDPRYAFASALPDSERGNERALSVTVDDGRMRIVTSGQERWSGPVPTAAGCTVVVRADQDGTTVSLRTEGDDEVLATAPGARVPEVTAFYTELTGTDGPSPTAVASPDARFQSSPTTVKAVLVALYLLGLLACLLWLRRASPPATPWRARWAQRRLERAETRARLRVERPVHLLADVGVVGALVGWTAIGYINTDDYYYTLEARTIDVAGFVGNQFRYFNVPEIPFVLHQMLLAPLTELSTAPFVLRLPSLAAGIAVWLLLTRQLLPLLVQRPHPALRLVAGIAFLAWWLPWNIGGRPESMVTLAWAVTLTLTLQAIRRDRVWLLGLAAAVAGAAVTITASGLSCVVTVLVLAPRWWPVVRDSALGRWATLALVVACASLPSAIVFSDASLAGALTALRVHQERGPAEAWYDELLRYYYLTMGPDPNQSTSARQVVVLGTLVLVVAVSVVLLRTTRVSAATASWSVPALAYLAASAALLPSPTKWTHHFGALAAPGALAVTVAVVVIARRRPDRWASGVLAVAVALTAALAFHGGNHQVEYSGYAVDEDLPGILGNPAPWLGVGLLTVAIPWWWHRRRARGEPIAPNWPTAAIGTLVAVLAASVLIQTGSAALAEYRLRNTWSMGSDTVDTLTGGGGCGLADSAVVLTEPQLLPAGPADDVDATTLQPVAATAVPDGDPDDLDDVVPPAVPIWSTFGDAGDDEPTRSTKTPWRELSGFSDRDALAVTVTGDFDDGTAVVMEYARVGDDGEPVLVEALPVDFATDSDREWRQYVLGGLIHLPQGATLVRMSVEDPGFTDDGWVATTDPYRVAGQPLRELVGDDPVVLDWPIGFNMPCFDPPAIRDGMVEPVRWVVLSSTYASSPELTVVDERGGSYSTVEETADTTEYIGFMPGVYPYEEWGEITRLDPRLPDDGYVVERSTRVVPGWSWWDGAGPGPDAD